MLIKLFNRSHILVFLIFIKKKVMTTIVQTKMVKMLNFVDRNYECINLFIIHIIT